MGVYALSNPNLNLLNFIKEDSNSTFNLLDVGCYDGANLKVLNQRYVNSNLYGLDIDKEVLNYASQCATVYCLDVEKDVLPFPTEFFDYVIFGDVLEHLHDPIKVVEKILTYLKPEGHILCSLPNLMNITVFEELLSGRFRYTDSGLLDRTHIHFFTYYEAIDLFNNCNLIIEDLRCFNNYLSENESELLNKLILLVSDNVEKFMLEAYQYYFLCRKK